MKAVEFPEAFKWLNTKNPLSLKMLKGHVVVLDFWTYCCINCMHILPDLKWIENKYRGKPVVVIGVHSAKFSNEQSPENIMEAIRRYEMEHPVIVDENLALWESYGVHGWPTLAVIDQQGNVAYQDSGEGQREYLDDTIEALLAKGEKEGGLAQPIEIERPQVKVERVLSYPGKLSFSPDGQMMVMSDSNHNRLLTMDTSGKISDKIGSGRQGFVDGGYDEAEFSRPQGVIWKDSKIYVADTENHALREVDLENKRVRTLAGTGKQGHQLQAGSGRSVSLSSPWDIAYDDAGLFIAMAGAHQIWYYDLEKDEIRPYAGSGYENIIDGILSRAQFAQPSGLSIDRDYLYVADSEVSGIRRMDLKKGWVDTVVGKGLFIFGYKDGALSEARFQHPLGVCADGDSLYVADTYNHAIRLIDQNNGMVSTLVGKPGMKTVCNINDKECDTTSLYEPNDVKVHDGSLYIVDTNNHLIRIFSLDKMILETLKVTDQAFQS